MSATGGQWMTPGEIEKALGRRKSREVFEDLIYDRRKRREILDLLIEATGCNEFSAEDFLREIVKTRQ
ncbi:MAG: hypothetical protein OXU79_18290 [Gemmatimonadota bacterium]|nr:hypothetical protein [Gemmatimonadota bacterium]